MNLANNNLNSSLSVCNNGMVRIGLFITGLAIFQMAYEAPMYVMM